MGYAEKKEYTEEENDPFFNMARKTLDCLDDIKKQMLIIAIIYPHDSPEKQKRIIDLTKMYYKFSVPLFPKGDKELESMQETILSLELKTRPSIKSGTQTNNFTYDKKLEKDLDLMFIKISKILRPYLMPDKKDDDGL